MPRFIQEQFLLLKFPDPILEFHTSFPDDPAGRALRETIRANFDGLDVDFGAMNIRFKDFWSVVAGTYHVVRAAPIDRETPMTCWAFLERAKPLLEALFVGAHHLCYPPLHEAVLWPLVANGRLDGRVLHAVFDQEHQGNGKYLIRIAVRCDAPQERRFVLNGQPRTMYRVGNTNAWSGVAWMNWDDGRPIYIQSHALRHLRERLNLPQVGQYIEAWLCESLKEPKVVERQGEDLLVEFRIREHRVGYLVVTPTEDAVAIRTFKFLTMENTPEARKLERKLKLSRPDVNWLRLHELESFTHTDLRSDPLLRRLMEECGCGHLFQLAEEHDFAPQPKALAAEVRKYLRLAA
jgi:hypothetical protein